MTDIITINEVIQLVKVEEKKIEVVTVGTQGPPGTGGSGSSDHGALAGLENDDHPQYHTDARGDARYYTKSQMDGALALIPKTGQVTVDFGNASGGESDLARVTVAAEAMIASLVRRRATCIAAKRESSVRRRSR